MAPFALPAGSWRQIGTVELYFTVDHKGIDVAPPFDHFQAIQLRVTGAPLNLIKIMISYEGGGTPTTLPMRISIPDGGVSPPIRLDNAGHRAVRRIGLWYATRDAGRANASVTVLGMQ